MKKSANVEMENAKPEKSTDNPAASSSDKTNQSKPVAAIHPYDISLQNRIAQGSTAIIYKATYKGQDVVVKQLNDEVNFFTPMTEKERKQKILDAFKLEALILSRLKSPYLINYVGSYFAGPDFSLVMEYMPDGDLYNFLRKPGEITWHVRYTIATETALGVQYLHQNKVIHGDLKSPNVVLKKDLDGLFHPKIVDFGMAMFTPSPSEKALGPVFNGGSGRWIAPEQFNSLNDEITAEADVYSFGMVLLEIADRRNPYPDIPASMVPYFLPGPKEEIREKSTPPRMAELMQQCWETRAEKRPCMDKIVEVLTEEQQTIPKP